MLAAPASMWVEPEIEVIDIDPVKYPEFPDHVALSTNALRAHMWEDAKVEEENAQLVNAARGAKALVDEQLKSALEQLARVSWLQRWAPWLIGGAALVAGGLGTLFGVVIDRAVSK